MDTPARFGAFAPALSPVTPLRAAITQATRREEAACLAPLLEAATLGAAGRARVAGTASALVTRLRAKAKGTGVEGLVQEYALSSQEGVALMCLAEALLRIPDTATRDALIRDKIAKGDWGGHLGTGKSLFVNAATWGLVVTGKLVGAGHDANDERTLSSALTRVLARGGQPMIRKALDLAMRMMGAQFVTGETISQALERARDLEAKGFRYSYDMLGEAATTAEDADRYYRDYEAAIHAIGKASAGRGVYAGPGISIKLSALHPRYSRQQGDRVMAELLVRVAQLARLAKRYDIGLNIDAEEADRLELSLDLLEALSFDPALAGWQGLGFVIQAYGKRCPFVIDWIVDLAHRAGRRIMVRLVKGAYWDAEIKRAQVDGLADFPVYTRKIHTDVAYIACAKKLLAAGHAVFPQFATHNAQTLATIYELANDIHGRFRADAYEFQCLHGMGEPLYSEVVGANKLDRPCRIYAPVGTHETLLAYLVRRLLENGANSSFVNRIADPAVAIADLVADPVDEVRAMAHPGARNPAIALPGDLYPLRRNSAGIDLADEAALRALSHDLAASAARHWHAAPAGGQGTERAVRNPADHADPVGTVIEAAPEAAGAALARAQNSRWASVPVPARAAMLDAAADAMQAAMGTLMGLVMREAGKSAANAIAEVREAIDFLRYYAQQARTTFTPAQMPLGPVVCISPWNFPLAIFIGQVSAALVAGNPVLAKPAEETPLIAAEAVRLLHAAGVPADALQLLPGEGALGAALVGQPGTAAVMFTGSTEVARAIQRQLAGRLSPDGRPVPLIAETGGQNAMIVDSSALAEQVVADVIASAFDSAGQRCSALRVLCLQNDVADRTLAMLKGALAELAIGDTQRLATDIGPVISQQAREMIEAHVAAMQAKGCRIERLALPEACASGTFVAPTIIEIDDIAQLGREVFGPVLHVLRWKQGDLDALIDAINATGYGLTFGLHTRLDDRVAHVTAKAAAGNLYVNRNVIGAIVGVQPFGGRGLSGTGPKAGGPLYLGRLVREAPRVLATPVASTASDPVFAQWLGWLQGRQDGSAHARVEKARKIAADVPVGLELELPGPVGERNLYAIHPRGTVLVRAITQDGLLAMLSAVLATGNRAVVDHGDPLTGVLADLPEAVQARIIGERRVAIAAALVEASGEAGGEAGGGEAVRAVLGEMAARDGAIAPVHVWPQGDDARWPLCALVEEVSTSINTTAAGGNASLMMLA